MRTEKAKDLNTLRAEIKKYDVISFDVFDTLLLRPFSKPTDLFFYIEDISLRKGFAEARIFAEQKLRSELKDSEEVLLDDIYKLIPKFKDLKQIELDTEQELLYANEPMLEIYKKVLALKKKVIIISDIYLSESFIAKVLTKNGFNGYSKLYISSSYGKEKWTGNLFRCALSDLKVSPKKILHIGDTYKSDIEGAQSIGIKTFYNPKVIDLFLTNCPFRKESSNKNWNLSAITMFCARRRRLGYENYWQRFGYEFAAPIVYAYTKWIINTIKNKHSDVTDIAFVARDGYLLKEFYEKLSEITAPKSHYIYAPRAMNISCRLDYDPDYQYVDLQLQAIANVFSDILPPETKQLKTKEELLPIIQQYDSKLREKAKENHEKYELYIEKQNFGSGKVVVVDTITDKFSAQSLFSSAIKNDVVGFYWFVLPNALKHKNVNFENFQPEHEFRINCWDLMEFILTAPEPSVKDLKGDKPVYNAPNPFEKRRCEIFLEMQKGMSDFLKDILNSSLKNLCIDSDSLVHWINSYLSNPSSDDFKAFSEVRFSIMPDHSDMMVLQPFAFPASVSDKKINRLKIFIKSHKMLYIPAKIAYQFVKFSIKIYAKGMRFIFRPVINAVSRKISQDVIKLFEHQEKISQDVIKLFEHQEKISQDMHKHIDFQKYETCGMTTENVSRLFTVNTINYSTFLQFKGKHRGQNIVIVGAGPSVNKFVKIGNAVYIGLNRAFKLKDVSFDYLFAIDKEGIKNYYSDFFAYRNGKTIKFIGDQNFGKNYQIPESVIDGDNIYRYITSTGHFADKFAYHLESQPLGNFVTVSLQAMQFALYTNPKRIYLVGIDCSLDGHFIGNTEFSEIRTEEEFNNNQARSIEDWKKVKEFVEIYYPDTEIISVNPVGLKGIFKDWYQDEE